jgi:hypothetical protein
MSEQQDGVDAFVDALGDLAEQLLTGDHVPETVEELVAVIDEAEDLRHYIDPADLAETIDLSKLPETVDVAELPEAAAEGEARRAIHLRKLLDAIDLTALVNSVDMRAAWREGRELDDAVDEMMAEDESAASDTDDDLVEFDDGSEDVADGADDEAVTGAFDGVEGDDLEALRMGVQQGVMEAVDEFREGLIDAHHELAELHAANRQASDERRQSESDNRNPTAVSTMPGGGRPLGSGTLKGSTVPTETKYSKTPNRKRIYGRRFEEERDE